MWGGVGVCEGGGVGSWGEGDSLDRMEGTKCDRKFE